MLVFDRVAAKQAGFSDQEIDAYMKENGYEDSAQVASPSPTQTPLPTSPPPTPVPGTTPAPLGKQNDSIPQPTTTNDVVPPLSSPMQTQYIGENPGNYPITGGHTGIDEIPTNGDTTIKNPIGGLGFQFQQYPGFGNAALVVGGNPQEISQMSPEEKQRIQDEVNAKGGTAASAADFNIPGRDVSIIGHTADYGNFQNGQPIATGSAQMTMGGSGGWSPHSHWEVNDRSGQTVDPIQFYQDKTGKQYPVNPSESYYTPSEIEMLIKNYGKTWQRK